MNLKPTKDALIQLDSLKTLILQLKSLLVHLTKIKKFPCLKEEESPSDEFFQT